MNIFETDKFGSAPISTIPDEIIEFKIFTKETYSISDNCVKFRLIRNLINTVIDLNVKELDANGFTVYDVNISVIDNNCFNIQFATKKNEIH